jgi:NAD(P)H-flavin reductase
LAHARERDELAAWIARLLALSSISPLDNHPFTIASSAPSQGKSDEQTPIVFLARSYSGFTAKLFAYATAHAEKGGAVNTSVWMDGPYGGIHRPLDSRYDSLILVAGGTGITVCLPWITETIQRAKTSKHLFLKRVVLVWAIRQADATYWIADELDYIAKKQGSGVEVMLETYVTGNATTSELAVMEGSTEEGISKEIERTESSIRTRDGRPLMSTILAEHIPSGERTMVIGCGPEGFKADLANAVAAAQGLVLAGKCTEIALHLETFGW